MKYFHLTLFLALFIPSLALAEVRITEIAWMGIAGTNGQYGEWFELYNSGTDAVNLAGWKLYASGGSQLVFTLTKSIPAGGYLLVERTTASMPDPVPGIDDESGTFGGGGFSNDGEYLVLKDGNGATIQSLDYASGWPAGDATTKQTMQWDGSKWITAPATPKAATSTSSGGDGEIPEATGSAASVISKSLRAPTPRTDARATITVPSDVYQYVDYKFIGDVVLANAEHPQFGLFQWNMGDGTTLSQAKLAPVFHHYDYPGTYTIWFGYYALPYDQEPLFSDTKTITVGLPALTIGVVDGTGCKIENPTDKIVDLSNWRISSGSQNAFLPAKTIVAPHASIIIPGSVLGIGYAATLALAAPNGTVIAMSNHVTHQAIATEYISGGEQTIETSDLAASATDPAVPADASPTAPKRNRTRTIVFGAVALIVIVLSILLERFMARQE